MGTSQEPEMDQHMPDRKPPSTEVF